MVGCYKFNCIQMSLVMSMRSIFGDDSFSVMRPLNFRLFIHVYSLLPERYFWSSLTRVLNQFRNKEKSIDVDKVGSKKPLASKSCFL